MADNNYAVAQSAKANGGGMREKLAALLLAGGILVSGIWTIQGMLQIGGGKPITTKNIKPQIATYIFQNLHNGATTLRNAPADLAKIPDQLGAMFDELDKQRPELHKAIKTMEGTIGSLGGLKKDIEDNSVILPAIKTPLLSSIDTLQNTLPVLLDVFKQLDAAVARTVASKTSNVNLVHEKIKMAVASINNQGIYLKDLLVQTGDLPTRMDALGDFLQSLNINI